MNAQTFGSNSARVRWGREARSQLAPPRGSLEHVQLTSRIAPAFVPLMVVGMGLAVYGITLNQPPCYSCTNGGPCGIPPSLQCPVPFDPFPFIALGAVIFVISLAMFAVRSRRPRVRARYLV